MNYANDPPEARMLLREAIEILEQYNAWRRGGDDPPAANPTEIGLAIDVALAWLKGLPSSYEQFRGDA